LIGCRRRRKMKGRRKRNRLKMRRREERKIIKKLPKRKKSLLNSKNLLSHRLVNKQTSKSQK
jgi:hypothetical protein